MLCCELPASVQFEPCGHRVTCQHCAARMKKCVRCQAAITGKATLGEADGGHGVDISGVMQDGTRGDVGGDVEFGLCNGASCVDIGTELHPLA